MPLYIHTQIHVHIEFVDTISYDYVITIMILFHLQILRVLDNFGCASISLRTFFSHQRLHLQPAIYSVWQNQQSTLLSQLKESGKKLIVGGDGRTDSPGHSAKFGSYTVIELECHAVLDIQLVQVLI